MQIVGHPMIPAQQNRFNHLSPLIYKLGLQNCKQMQIVGHPMIPAQQNRFNHLSPLIYKLGLLAHGTLRGKIGQNQSSFSR